MARLRVRTINLVVRGAAPSADAAARLVLDAVDRAAASLERSASPATATLSGLAPARVVGTAGNDDECAARLAGAIVAAVRRPAGGEAGTRATGGVR